MRTSCSWLFAILMLLSASAQAEPPAIPEFTPNVVDPSGVLDTAAKERVNAEIARIRGTSRIWAAVFIVDTLGGETSIEELAVRAFERWKLGQAGVDNGLLLVLAMKDRKSRFEVGYGLEGTITDVAALHALDAYLAPKMRAGDTAGAIVDSLAYLSRLVEKDPVAVQELANLDATASDDPSEDEDWGRGLRTWGLFLIPVWLTAPLRAARVALQRRQLLSAHPELAPQKGDEEVVTTKHGGLMGTLGVSLFLTVNPGVFILIFASMTVYVYYAAMAIAAVAMLFAIFFSDRRYRSPEAFQRHLAAVAEKRASLIRQGHVEETSPGVFSYTPAYAASRRSSSSSSSSYSSSRSSSSSGGGRSGGGGASSGW